MSWYDPYWFSSPFLPPPRWYDLYQPYFVEVPPFWPLDLVPEMNEDDIMKAVGWIGTPRELTDRLHWGEHVGIVRKHPFLFRWQLHPDMIKYLEDLCTPLEGGSGGGEKKKIKGDKGEKKDE